MGLVGEVIDERFEIERPVGAGAMGELYRARDRQTGAVVALKVVRRADAEERSRLAREYHALETLAPPGVVPYLAHGTTRAGRLYVATAWLDGHTLSERLALQPLSTAESVALGARAAAALGAIHQLGIVHRNLKPSNLLLERSAIDRVVLTDFGLARGAYVEQHLTMPGALLGVPGYLAPEQARGQAQIDARADVFALGCVLYKCLTGRPALQGAGSLAVLAKVILEEPPRLRELRDDIPPELEDLVFRMLSKAQDDRPRDGAAVAAELTELQRFIAGAQGRSPRARDSRARVREITSGERKLSCLVLAFSSAEVTPADERALALALEAMAARHKGALEMLDGRSPLIVLSDTVAPTDLAARAARCALAMKTLLDGVPIAVVTGRTEIAERLPVGELIDRAAELLATGYDAASPTIRIDEVTAGLLGARFELDQDAQGHVLRGAHEELDATPQLLGKPTPCVGRDRELALLTAEFQQCVEEPAATVVLVTGAAGMGKSRLRHELIRALRDQDQPLEVWVGKADPISAGSAFGLLAHALRRGLGLVDGEPIEARRRKVRSRVERHADLDAPRIAAFLGELVGVPFPDDDVKLRAARHDPMLMGDQIRLAWEDFLQAECAVQPVLLVLEDLHWGDLPTVNVVDAALRSLEDLPLMVLALGRPEVHKLFPRLWDGRRKHEVRLTPLLRRPSEQLVRQALGPSAAPELVSALAQRADGNPFYLEEQIRAAATGKTEGLPETVLAMVQTGLEAFDAEARRVLRAASIFGETFSHAGVVDLVGGVHVAPKLLELEQGEVIRRGDAGDSGEVEYRFRHALVREAAYGMLTEHDRRLGHALAGDWLERSGDADPMALAEHFERGGEPARAATAYLRAAQLALRGNDLAAAVSRAERGAACAAQPATVGSLRLVQAEALRWRGEYALAEQSAIDATAHLTPGDADWFAAVTEIGLAAGKLGASDRVEHCMLRARDQRAHEGALSKKLVCLSCGALKLLFSGDHELADALLDDIDQAMTTGPSVDATAIAKLHDARAARAHTGDPGGWLEDQKAALLAYEQTGDLRNACMARINLGFFYGELGHFEAAEGALRVGLAEAERLDLHDVISTGLHNLGLVRAYRGQLAQGAADEVAAIAAFRHLGDLRMEGGSRIYLARIQLLADDPRAAETEARAAEALVLNAPPLRAYAVAVRARALLDLGRTGEARAAAGEAFALLASVAPEVGESLVRLVYAEALAASGDKARADAAIASARQSLLDRAAKISDPAWRERFLRDVPDNASTLELARRRLGPPT